MSVTSNTALDALVYCWETFLGEKSQAHQPSASSTSFVLSSCL